MSAALGKLSVFPGGNVGGAGGKCLSDGDGLLSVIDDVLFFHNDNLPFILIVFFQEVCISRSFWI